MDKVDWVESPFAIVPIGPQDTVAGYASVHASNIAVYLWLANGQTVVPDENGRFVTWVRLGIRQIWDRRSRFGTGSGIRWKEQIGIS